MTEQNSEGQESPDRTLASRTERALYEKISVLETDTSGQFEIVSQSGRSYEVDLVADVCDCPDYLHRAPTGGCKHLRRARYATGADPVPSSADFSRVDDQLGIHVNDEPVVEDAGDHAVVADGGLSARTGADTSAQKRREDGETDADASEGDDESCWCATRDTPCWDCWSDGERR